MGPIQTIDEFLGLLLRRKLIIVAIVVIGAVVSAFYGMSRPKSYEAAAVIQVELPVVQADATVQGQRAAQVLQVIEQRLTTRENLLAMIDRHAIFAKAPGLPEAQRLTAMRNAIRFQPVAAADQPGYGSNAVSALIISVSLGDAEQAARMANDLAQSVLDQSAARQASRAKDSLAFYLQEEARITAAIAVLDDEIARYKNANADQLIRTEGDRTALETDLRRVEQEILAIQGERAALEGKQRLRETDRRRIEDLTVQEDVLTRQKTALESQRAALGQTAARAPEIERQLGAYTRQMEQLQTQIEQVAARRAQAETDLRLEQEQHAERFTLLERAVVPTVASGGGGKKIAAAGAAASLLLALGVAFALDLMNPVIRSAAQMQRELDITPVITLPDIAVPRRRGWLAGIMRRGRTPA